MPKEYGENFDKDLTIAFQINERNRLKQRLIKLQQDEQKIREEQQLEKREQEVVNNDFFDNYDDQESNYWESIYCSTNN